MFFFLIIIILDNINKYSKEKQLKVLFLNYSLIFNGIIMALYLNSLYLKLEYFSNNLNEINDLLNVEYFDFGLYSYYYNMMYDIESLLFFLATVKIIIFVKLEQKLAFLYDIMEGAFVIFLKYSAFFITILLGFAIIFHVFYGPYILEFSNIPSSIIQVMLLTLGILLIFINIY
jgi:hypothetical protein